MKAHKFLNKGYKAMHGNFQYAVGQTYTHNGDIELCKSGFHASKEIRDAIQHCSGSHLVEVELGGDIIRGVGKIVASEITILRELDIVRELEVLAGDENAWVRCCVAKNSNTPVEVLRILADDEDSDVRYYIAQNPSTPAEALKTLAGDEKWWVRYHVAIHPNTSVETLKTLADDEHSWVHLAVARNPQNPCG